jgi:glycosyltransferase 2 family protein
LSLKSIVIHIFKTIFPLALGIYLIWYFFHSMSDESLNYFYSALSKANYFWICLSLFLSFLCYLSRAYRWKYLLEPMGFKSSFWNRYHALMIGYIINLTIPRAGEASRSAMLFRSDGVPFSKSFGTIIAERAVDLMMLGIVGLITLFVSYDDFIILFSQIKNEFSSVKSDSSAIDWKNLIFFFVLSLLGVFFLLLIFKVRFRRKIIAFTKEIITGIFSIFKSKNPIAFIGHTVFYLGNVCFVFFIAFFQP